MSAVKYKVMRRTKPEWVGVAIVRSNGTRYGVTLDPGKCSGKTDQELIEMAKPQLK